MVGALLLSIWYRNRILTAVRPYFFMVVKYKII
jgi:hypothetical protein